MNPTAEDILNQYKTMNWDHEYAENGILSFEDAKKAMKEAADKAWEAGNKFKADIESGHYAESKETFMKELFKDHG